MSAIHWFSDTSAKRSLRWLYTGQATDPNSGPLLALMAIALLAGREPASGPSGS